MSIKLSKSDMKKLHSTGEIEIGGEKITYDQVNEKKVELDDKTKFQLDLKHLLDKHLVKEMAEEVMKQRGLKGYSKFLVSKDNPKGETSGLDDKTLSKILMRIGSKVEETIQLGENLNEELCAKGKAYIRKRKAAGEKSSAYLSGRAVKVCKGQMKG